MCAFERVVSFFQLGDYFIGIDRGFVVTRSDSSWRTGCLGPADEGVSCVWLDDAQDATGFEDAMELCEYRVPLLIEMVQYVDTRYRVECVIFEGQGVDCVSDGGMKTAAVREFDALWGDIESNDG